MVKGGITRKKLIHDRIQKWAFLIQSSIRFEYSIALKINEEK